jgi:4-hydroxy-tetrahydrodipicolinate synthase
MDNTREIKGIVPVLTTPLNRDGSVDESALRNIVEFLISTGVGGFWALGTGSEDMNLSFSRRVKIAQIVSETNRERVPVLLGASFYATEDILAFIQETHPLAVDAFHVMAYHNLLGLDRVKWLYRFIADNSPKPIWMYSSANYGRSLPPAVVAELAKHPNIRGIKYSTKNALDIAKVAMLADGVGFQVMTAVAGILYTCLSLGVKSHTTSLASCLPEPLIEIHDLFLAGDRSGALQKQMAFVAFCETFPPRLRTDNFFQAAEEKYILHLRGLCSEYTTSYYSDVTEEEKATITEALKTYRYPPFHTA